MSTSSKALVKDYPITKEEVTMEAKKSVSFNTRFPKGTAVGSDEYMIAFTNRTAEWFQTFGIETGPIKDEESSEESESETSEEEVPVKRKSSSKKKQESSEEESSSSSSEDSDSDTKKPTKKKASEKSSEKESEKSSGKSSEKASTKKSSKKEKESSDESEDSDSEKLVISKMKSKKADSATGSISSALANNVFKFTSSGKHTVLQIIDRLSAYLHVRVNSDSVEFMSCSEEDNVYVLHSIENIPVGKLFVQDGGFGFCISSPSFKSIAAEMTGGSSVTLSTPTSNHDILNCFVRLGTGGKSSEATYNMLEDTDWTEPGDFNVIRSRDDPITSSFAVKVCISMDDYKKLTDGNKTTQKGCVINYTNGTVQISSALKNEGSKTTRGRGTNIPATSVVSIGDKSNMYIMEYFIPPSQFSKLTVSRTHVGDEVQIYLGKTKNLIMMSFVPGGKGNDRIISSFNILFVTGE